MNLVGYYRVSTDDKGQDPKRQRDVVEAWAKQNGHVLVHHVEDEGTSGATDPFQRQAMREAIQQAEDLEADGIVVEAVDRATRGGVEALMVFRFVLRLEHGKRLVVANNPAGLTPALEEMFDSIMATVARMFRERLKEQIKSGIARAKSQGWPNGMPGRQPKPKLTLAEKDLVRDLVAQGQGVDKVALAISKSRGAYELADPGARDRAKVGPTWLWKAVRSEMPDVGERWTARRAKFMPANGQVREPVPANQAGVNR